MFKILKSLAMILIVTAAVAGATKAFWSAGEIKPGNTFSMGDVSLGTSYGFPFHMDNLAPGEVRSTDLLQLQYTGSLPADLYFGLKDEGGGYDLRPILQMQIEKYKWNGSAYESIGWVFSGWTPIQTGFETWSKAYENVTQNQWTAYKVFVKVSDTASNDYKNKSATDSVIIRAVQTGQTLPGETVPQYYVSEP